MIAKIKTDRKKRRDLKLKLGAVSNELAEVFEQEAPDKDEFEMTLTGLKWAKN